MDTKILKKEISIDELLNYRDLSVLENCQNCNNYDKNYSCPSFEFEIIDFLKDYSKCILYGKKFYTDSELLEFKLSNEMYLQFKNELFNKYKKDVNEGLEKLEGIIKDSNAIFVGHCDKCEKCARLTGENCYYPMMAHYSLESLGINKEKLLKEEFNEEIIRPENHKMDEYLILLGAVLKK